MPKKNYVPSMGEVNNEPSQTIPGQEIPIRTMIEKQRQGMIILGNGLDYTDDDQPMPRLNDLTDLDEAEQHLKRFKAEVMRLKAEALKATNETAPGGE